MYQPAHFVEQRPEILQQLADTHPLAQLVWTDADGTLQADAVPMLLTRDAEGWLLQGHVARANPLWRQAGAEGMPALALFNGPQAYVSPGWYASKKEHGKMVPTWNYISAQARGTLCAIEDRDWLYAFVDRLSERFEAGRVEPWRITDAPADFTDKLLTQIVGIEMRVAHLQGKWKVSQNRSTADRTGVADGLEAEGTAQARAMAAWVRHYPEVPTESES